MFEHKMLRGKVELMAEQGVPISAIDYNKLDEEAHQKVCERLNVEAAEGWELCAMESNHDYVRGGTIFQYVAWLKRRY